MHANLKLIIVGSPAVGKSALLSSFTKQQPLAQRDQTKDGSGVEKFTRRLTIDKVEFDLELWEMGGSMSSISRSCCNDADGMVLVYDSTNRDSFVHAESLLKTASSEICNDNLAIGMVGTKIDSNAPKEVTTNEGAAFAEQHDCVFVETAALTGPKNAKDCIFIQLVQKIHEATELLKATQNGGVLAPSSVANKPSQKPSKSRSSSSSDENDEASMGRSIQRVKDSKKTRKSSKSKRDDKGTAEGEALKRSNAPPLPPGPPPLNAQRASIISTVGGAIRSTTSAVPLANSAEGAPAAEVATAEVATAEVAPAEVATEPMSEEERQKQLGSADENFLDFLTHYQKFYGEESYKDTTHVPVFATYVTVHAKTKEHESSAKSAASTITSSVKDDTASSVKDDTTPNHSWIFGVTHGMVHLVELAPQLPGAEAEESESDEEEEDDTPTQSLGSARKQDANDGPVTLDCSTENPRIVYSSAKPNGERHLLQKEQERVQAELAAEALEASGRINDGSSTPHDHSADISADVIVTTPTERPILSVSEKISMTVGSVLNPPSPPTAPLAVPMLNRSSASAISSTTTTSSVSTIDTKKKRKKKPKKARMLYETVLSCPLHDLLCVTTPYRLLIYPSGEEVAERTAEVVLHVLQRRPAPRAPRGSNASNGGGRGGRGRGKNGPSATRALTKRTSWWEGAWEQLKTTAVSEQQTMKKQWQQRRKSMGLASSSNSASGASGGVANPALLAQQSVELKKRYLVSDLWLSCANNDARARTVDALCKAFRMCRPDCRALQACQLVAAEMEEWKEECLDRRIRDALTRKQQEKLSTINEKGFRNSPGKKKKDALSVAASLSREAIGGLTMSREDPNELFVYSHGLSARGTMVVRPKMVVLHAVEGMVRHVESENVDQKLGAGGQAGASDETTEAQTEAEDGEAEGGMEGGLVEA
jgi:small GTP-binding protein